MLSRVSSGSELCRSKPTCSWMFTYLFVALLLTRFIVCLLGGGSSPHRKDVQCWFNTLHYTYLVKQRNVQGSPATLPLIPREVEGKDRFLVSVCWWIQGCNTSAWLVCSHLSLNHIPTVTSDSSKWLDGPQSQHIRPTPMQFISFSANSHGD